MATEHGPRAHARGQKILFGELHAGDIVAVDVDVDGEGDNAHVPLRRQRQAADPGRTAHRELNGKPPLATAEEG